MAILSVVIPAFNAERHIGQCVKSVLQQPDYKGNVQILIVVDGASDRTFSVAQETAFGNEDTVRIFTQENLGASTARNKGIAHVTTEYVTFLDADDAWSSDYLSTLLPLLSEGPDLIEYDSLLTDEDGRPQGLLKIASAPTGIVKEVQAENFLDVFRCYAWARVCRTRIVRAHPFPDGRRFEDSATTPWYYWESKRIVSVGKCLIAYRQHPESVLATPRPQDVMDICDAISESATMYKRTKSNYWQFTVYRTLHFAFQRTSMLPFEEWPEIFRTAKMSITGVPHPPGLVRWLQVHVSAFYVVLILLRRKLTLL